MLWEEISHLDGDAETLGLVGVLGPVDVVFVVLGDDLGPGVGLVLGQERDDLLGAGLLFRAALGAVGRQGVREETYRDR